MPIFEYICRDCGKQFESVLFGSQEAECPSCQGKQLDQQLSKFAVGATKSNSMPPCGGGMCGGGGCGMA